MIGGKLNHSVIIFRAQIHEVIVDRVYYLPFDMHLVMQMRTGALARTPYPSYHFSPYHLLTQLRAKISQMRIPCLISETMIYHDGISVSGLPSHLHHCSVAGCIHVRSGRSGEIHAGMEFHRSINGVDPSTVSGGCLAKILIRNRLNGRHTFQHLTVFFTHFSHISKRFGLNVELLGKHIQLLSGVDRQSGISLIHQLFITVRTAISCLSDSRSYRIGLHYDAVEVIVALLNVTEYFLRIIQSARKHIVLCQKSAVFYRSEEHTSELQSRQYLVCRLL